MDRDEDDDAAAEVELTRDQQHQFLWRQRKQVRALWKDRQRAIDRAGFVRQTFVLAGLLLGLIQGVLAVVRHVYPR